MPHQSYHACLKEQHWEGARLKQSPAQRSKREKNIKNSYHNKNTNRYSVWTGIPPSTSKYTTALIMVGESNHDPNSLIETNVIPDNSPGPRFPKASLAYVDCEVHRTSVVEFSPRFPKASLLTSVIKTLVDNDASRGTRRGLRASLAYYSLSGGTSWTFRVLDVLH